MLGLLSAASIWIRRRLYGPATPSYRRELIDLVAMQEKLGVSAQESADTILILQHVDPSAVDGYTSHDGSSHFSSRQPLR